MKYLILFLLSFSILVIKAQTFKELNDSLIYHYQAQRFEQAIPFAEKVVVFVKENYGEENKIYNTYLGMLASLYISTQQLQKAAPLLLQSNNLNNKLFGEKSKEYIKGITQIGRASCRERV